MKTREDKIYSFFGHLIMTILTLLAIIPILLMFISSLTDNATLILFSAEKVEYLCL